MAEGGYEAACMRAELLGLDKPSPDDFPRRTPASQRSSPVPEESERVAAAAAQFEEISLQNEELHRVGGGLTELNAILSGTQKRLNRLKGVCGSLTDLIKNKLGGSKDNMSYSTDRSYLPPDGIGTSNDPRGDANPALDDLDAMPNAEKRSTGKDIDHQISSQVSKLEALLDKAENAQYSMDHQNKQMKKFLK